jgi:hypothetical protein
MTVETQQPSLPRRWAVAKVQAWLTLQRAWDESQHPREPPGSPEGGQFAGGGSGGSAAETAESEKLDPTVVKVGGDEWNQAVALRLEREYQAARPKIDKLANEAPGKTSTGAVIAAAQEDEEEWPPYVPESWDEMSNAQQEEAGQQYVDKNQQAYHDSEVENWQSEYALDEARQKIAEDFNAGQNTEWAVEALDDMRDAREENGDPPIPYTNDELIANITLTYEAGVYPKKDVAVSIGFGPDPSQMTLPGVEGPTIDPEVATQLTEEMREQIEGVLAAKFEKQADADAPDMEPPSYLMQNAIEFAGESWNQMGDEEKYEWVKGYTEIIETKDGTPVSATLQPLDKLPIKFDPLQREGTVDYVRTQKLARWLSVARTREILTERKLPAPPDETLAHYDTQLWSAWKSSSTSTDGQVLQLATADELGGRLNVKTAAAAGEFNRKSLLFYADREYSKMGGYEGVKAYLRAKWETTQYLLDKADVKELALFRSIALDKDLRQKLFVKNLRPKMFALLKHLQNAEDINGYTHMKTLDVKRNGAASTSLDAGVSNGWGLDDTRIVLRAKVPRTAAISVPAYGINVHSEREVVVAGTAWKGWDAWAGKAPEFNTVPLRHAA